MLGKKGFSNEVIAVLRCITQKLNNEDHNDFIERINQHLIAVKIKTNDLLDNMDKNIKLNH